MTHKRFINEPVAAATFILLSAFKKNRREEFQDILRPGRWIALKQRIATLILVIIALVKSRPEVFGILEAILLELSSPILYSIRVGVHHWLEVVH